MIRRNFVFHSTSADLYTNSHQYFFFISNIPTKLFVKTRIVLEIIRIHDQSPMTEMPVVIMISQRRVSDDQDQYDLRIDIK